MRGLSPGVELPLLGVSTGPLPDPVFDGLPTAFCIAAWITSVTLE